MTSQSTQALRMALLLVRASDGLLPHGAIAHIPHLWLWEAATLRATYRRWLTSSC